MSVSSAVSSSISLVDAAPILFKLRSNPLGIIFKFGDTGGAGKECGAAANTALGTMAEEVLGWKKAIHDVKEILKL